MINTLSGDGTGAYSGDGGAATDAQLNVPVNVAVDGVGNIYISDYSNDRIRKITAITGLISTVAGSGAWGYSGDGGAATSAELEGPEATAVDAAGNIYIADYYGQRIRKVTASTGKISTVAGNGISGYSGDGQRATKAKLNYPSGVTLDKAGNIYIADSHNHRIRKVTISTGKISSVAGIGIPGYSGDGRSAIRANLNLPVRLAVDTAGNIYIADYYNERIRKVTASTGTISTVAGNGTAGYSGDGGLATDTELAYPSGVAVDNTGNIYIEDFYNQRIRKVTAATGTISTVAGNGTAGYSGDGGTATSAEINEQACSGISVDNLGNIYIADTGNNRIRAVGAN